MLVLVICSFFFFRLVLLSLFLFSTSCSFSYVLDVLDLFLGFICLLCILLHSFFLFLFLRPFYLSSRPVSTYASLRLFPLLGFFHAHEKKKRTHTVVRVNDLCFTPAEDLQVSGFYTRTREGEGDQEA